MSDPGYNYPHFRFAHYRPGREHPVEAGGPARDATVHRPNGSTVRLSDLWRERPLVLEFGSITCGVFVHKIPAMDHLARRFEGRAAFRVLYVREAHPGRNQPPHRSLEDKQERASALREREGMTRPVLVDGVGGPVHRPYGAHPNAVCIVGTDGVVSYRADWCEPEEVEAELERLLEAGGEGAGVAPHRREDNFGEPTAGLLRTSIRVMRQAGSPSLRDFFSQIPRMLAYRVRQLGGDTD